MTSFTHRSVLVVEDDFLQAESTTIMLRDAEIVVVGPYSNIEAALGALRSQPVDCVLLDLDLGRGLELGAARDLCGRGLPVVLVTGYGPEILPADIVALPRVEKPFMRAAIMEALNNALAAS